MQVSQRAIASAAVRLGLGDRPLMVHSSLASFGNLRVEPQAVLRGLLDGSRTILVPSFSWTFGVPRPAHQAALVQNGVEDGFAGPTAGAGRVYTPTSREVDRDMGAVVGELLRMRGIARGMHPLNSFAAAGPDAKALVSGQTGTDVYAPVRELARRDGHVLLMGVGLDSMTALHAAEERAGRRLFRRWPTDPTASRSLLQSAVAPVVSVPSTRCWVDSSGAKLWVRAPGAYFRRMPRSILQPQRSTRGRS